MSGRVLLRFTASTMAQIFLVFSPFIELTCHSHYSFFVQLVSKWVFWNDKQRALLSVFFVEFNFEWKKRDPLSHMKKLFDERDF